MRRLASPGVLLSGCAMLVAVCAFLIAHLRTSQLVLQLALVVSGVAYGLTDPASPPRWQTLTRTLTLTLAPGTASPTRA